MKRAYKINAEQVIKNINDSIVVKASANLSEVECEYNDRFYTEYKSNPCFFLSFEGKIAGKLKNENYYDIEPSCENKHKHFDIDYKQLPEIEALYKEYNEKLTIDFLETLVSDTDYFYVKDSDVPDAFIDLLDTLEIDYEVDWYW